MLPAGLCIDLETTITGRVPDKIRPRGQKRYETRVIEIGAIDWKSGRHWGCLVNPLKKLFNTSAELFQHLRDIHQKPDATLDFWSKVLVKRGAITPNMVGGEPPVVWLARTTANRANDFVRWFRAPETGPAFVSERAALQGLVAFTRQHERDTWLAHNGKSFDFKVLAGAAERHGLVLPQHIQQVDTLHVFRKAIPGHKSYSQPVLYQAIFGHKYNAHVAIDDAKALARLCKHVHTVQKPNVSVQKPANTFGLQFPADVQKPTTAKKAIDLTFGQSYHPKKKSTSAKKAMNLTFQKRRRRKKPVKPPTTAELVHLQTLIHARVLLRKALHYFK